MWAPEAFQPNILIIAGGNYRTGRCTDGRKVKVLAWLGTWQFFLPIHGGQIVDQAMFFFVFCGNTWLFDVIWITQRRKVPYIWCHFDAFQCGDVKQLNGAPSSAGLRSMPCPPNAFGFAWSWGRPIEGWRDRRKQISGWWGLIQVPIFRSQFFLSTKTHAIYYCWWQPENPKGPTTVFWMVLKPLVNPWGQTNDLLPKAMTGRCWPQYAMKGSVSMTPIIVTKWFRS